MNVAFKHLEAKLRLGELTVGQWASVTAGVLFALAFSQYLNPLGGMPGLVIGVYLGAIPASAAFLASTSEFDLGGLVIAAVRRQRTPGRYVPGPGRSADGYIVTADSAPGPDAEPGPGQVIDLDALWD